MKNKVLLIGNDSNVNSIDFSKIQPNIIKVGTNRAWLKLIPNYLFFHDPKIFLELDNNQDRLSELKKHTRIISSDWLQTGCSKINIKPPGYTTIYSRPNKKKYVDCVTTAIDILDRHILNKRNTTFYIAGVSLIWKNPSHFWKKNPIDGIGNSNDKKWHEKRFKLTLENFKHLKDRGFDIVSSTPCSKINSLFRYEHIENLYN